MFFLGAYAMRIIAWLSYFIAGIR